MWSLTLFPNLNTQSLLSMQIACESPCSSLFFCCYDKMPWQNQLRRGKGSLNWHFQGTVHQGRKEEWELKVRTLRQELKQRLWRSIDFSLLSWATQDHLPKDGLGLSPPTSTVNQKKKKWSTNIPQVQSDGGNASFEVPSFPDDFNLYQADKNKIVKAPEGLLTAISCNLLGRWPSK